MSAIAAGSATLASKSALATTIKLGERVMFFGHTGSGKTYLATHLLGSLVPARLPVVVVDPKREFEPLSAKGWVTFDQTKGQELPRSWERRIERQKRPSLLRVILRPSPLIDDPRKNDWLNAAYLRIFVRHEKDAPCLVYLDELARLVYNNRGHPYLTQLVYMGRSKRISVWAGTQRPTGIPRSFVSESDHVFTFFLRDLADRQRASEIMGGDAEPPGPGPHDLWYMPPGTKIREPILIHQGDEDGVA